MSEQTLKDKHGNLLGYIKEEGNQLGIRDKHPNNVGKDNLLTTLLPL